MNLQESVIAGMLNDNECARIAWETITPQHFTGELRLAAEAAHHAYQHDKTCEPNIVMATLIALGYARRFPGDKLISLFENGRLVTPATFTGLLLRLEEEHQRLKVQALAARLSTLAATPSADFHTEASRIATEITTAVRTTQTDPLSTTVTLQTLLDMDFPQQGNVIPGLFKARSRVVVTGPEGKGKSEMTYQIAVGAARGMHPFGMTDIPQQKVLVVDAENEQVDLQTRLRRINGVYDGMGANPAAEYMRIQDALGWNLLDSRDAGFLFSLVRQYMPDLLVIGPVYQVMGGDANDAETVRRFMRVVDECRAISDCAVLTEAHAGHGEAGNRNNWRPSGSSLWLRWPDMGIGLSPLDQDGSTMELVRWRGDRVANEWPEAVRRGGILPWTEDVR